MIHLSGSDFFTAKSLEDLRGVGAVVWVDLLCDPPGAGVRYADVY